ncbi:MAG: DUF362 domain-containing protein [Thermodesulfobacteriota bacterium]
MDPPWNVHVFQSIGYDSRLNACIREALNASRFSFSGQRVLVKPNLVAGKNRGLGCTDPRFVYEACRCLIDLGAKVSVGDSPAFGSGDKVARTIGLDHVLATLGLSVKTLGAKKKMSICGENVNLSSFALEADVIVNLPKLKTHSQMRISAAVKNLFGCLPGFQKALWHARIGSDRQAFARFILEISDCFPRVFNLVDAVTVLHRGGPIQGQSFCLQSVLSGDDALAVDTAIYSLLGLLPDDVPLWQAAAKKKMAQADPDLIHVQGEACGLWADVQIPLRLKSADFSPVFLFLSFLRRLKQRILPGF